MLIYFLLCAVFNGNTKLMKERESSLRPKVRESSVGKERTEKVEDWRDVPQSTTTRTHTFNGIGIKGTTDELRKQVGVLLLLYFSLSFSCPFLALLFSFSCP